MRTSNYDKMPTIAIRGCDHAAWSGYEAIRNELGRKLAALPNSKNIVTVECYPGVRVEEVIRGLQGLGPVQLFRSDEAALDKDVINGMIERYMTDDRVFGYMSNFTIGQCLDPAKIAAMRSGIDSVQEGLVVVIGVGASCIHRGNVLVYADLARWEIQLRFRSKEFGNWLADNRDEDILRKVKRGYFFEWRAADRLKKELFEQSAYFLDTNVRDDPRMVTGEAFLIGLQQATERPFRLVPYFDPGVWGGQWMKEVCDLDRSQPNFAWSFDGVPEENSLYMRYGDVRLEFPAINLVFRNPKELLGEYVYARFGAEFPIRFDFLDTMGGQNLSLQVHPVAQYMREQFGMPYTQDESYYILDADADAVVYLGLKDGIDPARMIADLKRAQAGDMSFPAERYVNVFPARKHDHFLIPAGTVHCSGTNAMVLEISATPYIFTFKLWDWDRLGLDGKPRPVHIEHGEKVIEWDRTTDWVREELVNRIAPVRLGDGWREERTGLHRLQFIETRRHWFSAPVHHDTEGRFHMLNLVEGEEAIVESPDRAFEPFVVHYAETFIVPAKVGAYTIRPYGQSEGKEIATIKAYVK